MRNQVKCQDETVTIIAILSVILLMLENVFQVSRVVKELSAKLNFLAF